MFLKNMFLKRCAILHVIDNDDDIMQVMTNVCGHTIK